MDTFFKSFLIAQSESSTSIFHVQSHLQQDQALTSNSREELSTGYVLPKWAKFTHGVHQALGWHLKVLEKLGGFERKEKKMSELSGLKYLLDLVLFREGLKKKGKLSTYCG